MGSRLCCRSEGLWREQGSPEIGMKDDPSRVDDSPEARRTPFSGQASGLNGRGIKEVCVLRVLPAIKQAAPENCYRVLDSLGYHRTRQLLKQGSNRRMRQNCRYGR